MVKRDFFVFRDNANNNGTRLTCKQKWKVAGKNVSSRIKVHGLLCYFGCGLLFQGENNALKNWSTLQGFAFDFPSLFDKSNVKLLVTPKRTQCVYMQWIMHLNHEFNNFIMLLSMHESLFIQLIQNKFYLFQIQIDYFLIINVYTFASFLLCLTITSLTTWYCFGNVISGVVCQTLFVWCNNKSNNISFG